MDIQAVDSALALIAPRVPRGDATDESGRQFSNELTQALAQRRSAAAVRPEEPRSDERRGTAVDRPAPDRSTPPSPRSDDSGTRARPRDDEPSRADARRERRDQVRADAATAKDRAKASEATQETDDADTEANPAPQSQTASITEDKIASPQPAENPSTDRPAAEKPEATAIDPTVAVAALVITTPAVVAPTPAPPVATPSNAVPGTEPPAIERPGAVAAAASTGAAPSTPVETAPAATPAARDNIATPAVPSAPADGSSPQIGEQTAFQAAAPTVAPQPVADASAPPTDTAQVLAAPSQPEGPAASIASTVPPVTEPAVTDPAVTITVVAEAPVVKAVTTTALTLQKADDAVTAPSRVENAPAPTNAVTSVAIAPSGQGATISSQQQQTPNFALQTPVAAPEATEAAPATASGAADFAGAIDVPAETAPAETAPTQGQASEPAQIVNAGNERRTDVQQTNRAEQAPPTRQNLPPQPVADQIAVRVAKQTQAGDGRISMQLRPDALGAIDVDLQVNRDGTMKAVISVEKPETLEWLKRDAQHLERALQDVGVKTDSGSLSFALREQRQEGSGSFAKSGSRRGSGFGSGGDTAEGRISEAALADATARRVARGGVDVKI